MGCCGDKLKAIKTISQAHAQFVYEKVFRVSGKKYEWTDDRIRACHKCGKQTWMTRMEYIAWICSNAKDILRHIDDLSILPELPKLESRPKTKLFCMICKCWIPGKARVKENTCPENLWPS